MIEEMSDVVWAENGRLVLRVLFRLCCIFSFAQFLLAFGCLAGLAFWLLGVVWVTAVAVGLPW